MTSTEGKGDRSRSRSRAPSPSREARGKRQGEHPKGQKDILQGKKDNIKGKADSIQGETDSIKGKANSIQGKADSIQGETDSIKGKANSIQGKADDLQQHPGQGQQHPGQGQQHPETDSIKGVPYKANMIQGMTSYLHGSVGGLSVVIDPAGEFAVAASQPSSIIPIAQLGQFAAQSSSEVLFSLAQLAAGAFDALQDSQCPTDEEIVSNDSCIAVCQCPTDSDNDRASDGSPSSCRSVKWVHNPHGAPGQPDDGI